MTEIIIKEMGVKMSVVYGFEDIVLHVEDDTRYDLDLTT